MAEIKLDNIPESPFEDLFSGPTFGEVFSGKVSLGDDKPASPDWSKLAHAPEDLTVTQGIDSSRQPNRDDDFSGVFTQEELDASRQNPLLIKPDHIDWTGVSSDVSTPPEGLTFKDLLDKGGLPEGTKSIESVFDNMIASLRRFLTEEDSGSSVVASDPLQSEWIKLRSRVGIVEARRSITGFLTKLEDAKLRLCAMIAMLPVDAMAGGFEDYEMSGRGNGGSGSISLPGFGIEVTDAFNNLGWIHAMALTMTNHLLNALDRKVGVDMSDYLREFLRPLIFGIWIFALCHNHPLWAKGTVFAVTELSALFAKYGERAGGPFAKGSQRYAMTMTVNFLAALGLL